MTNCLLPVRGSGSIPVKYTSKSMSAEKRLLELKLELPTAPKPVAVYKSVVIAGNLAYVSGHGPLKSDGTMITGRVEI